MKKIKFNKKTKNILTWVLGGCLLFGAIFGIMSLFNKAEAKTQSITPSYAVGSLNATTGKYVDSKGSIYTKNAFDCNGLKTTLDFDNNIKYQLFFYDFDENFLSASNILTENFKDEVPFTAKSCRIVITPNEDDNINFFEISKYSKQLKIEVANEQPKDLSSKIQMGENVATILGKGIYEFEQGQLSENANSPWYFLSPIDVSETNTIYVKVKTSSLVGNVSFSGTSQPKVLTYLDGTQETLTYQTICVVDDFTYISYNVSICDSFIMTVDIASADCVGVWLID